MRSNVWKYLFPQFTSWLKIHNSLVDLRPDIKYCIWIGRSRFVTNNMDLRTSVALTFIYCRQNYNVGREELGKQPLERPRRKWEGSIRLTTNPREMWCEEWRWMELAQDRDQWRTLVPEVISLRVVIREVVTIFNCFMKLCWTLKSAITKVMTWHDC